MSHMVSVSFQFVFAILGNYQAIFVAVIFMSLHGFRNYIYKKNTVENWIQNRIISTESTGEILHCFNHPNMLWKGNLQNKSIFPFNVALNLS